PVVRDLDVPAAVGRHAGGGLELSVPQARAAPRGEEGAAAPARWYRGRCSVRERSGGHGGRSRTRRAQIGTASCGGAAPRGEEGGLDVERLDAVVPRVRDVDVPAAVGRHALGAVELPVAAARAAPRGEEGAAAPARWYRGRCSVRERSGGHGCRSRTRRA